jgi:hypothetical protein
MHFEITAALQAIHKHQRNSSLFSESPRIGAQTLRRGQVMSLSEKEFAAKEVAIKRLFDAGAIEIFQVDGKDRVNLRDAKKAYVKHKEAPVRGETKVAAVLDEKIDTQDEVKVIIPEAPPEVVEVPEAVEVPVANVEPVQGAPAAPLMVENVGKGKKGRK